MVPEFLKADSCNTKNNVISISKYSDDALLQTSGLYTLFFNYATNIVRKHCSFLYTGDRSLDGNDLVHTVMAKAVHAFRKAYDNEENDLLYVINYVKKTIQNSTYRVIDQYTVQKRNPLFIVTEDEDTETKDFKLASLSMDFDYGEGFTIADTLESNEICAEDQLSSVDFVKRLCSYLSEEESEIIREFFADNAPDDYTFTSYNHHFNNIVREKDVVGCQYFKTKLRNIIEKKFSKF